MSATGENGRESVNVPQRDKRSQSQGTPMPAGIRESVVSRPWENGQWRIPDHNGSSNKADSKKIRCWPNVFKYAKDPRHWRKNEGDFGSHGREIPFRRELPYFDCSLYRGTLRITTHGLWRGPGWPRQQPIENAAPQKLTSSIITEHLSLK